MTCQTYYTMNNEQTNNNIFMRNKENVRRTYRSSEWNKM